MKSIYQILAALGVVGSRNIPGRNLVSILAGVSPVGRRERQDPWHIQAWKIERAKAKRERKAARRVRELDLARKGAS